MKRNVQIQQIVSDETGLRVTVLVAGRPAVDVLLALQSGEPLHLFRARAHTALRRTMIQHEVARQRASDCAASLAGLTFDLDPPDPPTLTLNGEKLEGEVAPGTAAVLVRLREPGGDREVVLAPNKLGRISASVGAAAVLSAVPITDEGLPGDPQVRF